MVIEQRNSLFLWLTQQSNRGKLRADRVCITFSQSSAAVRMSIPIETNYTAPWHLTISG